MSTGNRHLVTQDAATGAQYSIGTVTQATNPTTAVTLNGLVGKITTFSNSDVPGAAHTFTVNNTSVVATSAVLASISNYAGTYTTNGLPAVCVNNIGAGSFDIIVQNHHDTGGNNLSGALIIDFYVFP